MWDILKFSVLGGFQVHERLNLTGQQPRSVIRYDTFPDGIHSPTRQQLPNLESVPDTTGFMNPSEVEVLCSSGNLVGVLSWDLVTSKLAGRILGGIRRPWLR